MEKELTIKDKVTKPIIIQHDDLKFDGKNITIPKYYIDSLCEYIKDYKTEGESQADIDDYVTFRDFLYDIQEFKNKGN
jgi:hypothetical protein